jgi:hypothetical protein
MLFCLVVLVVVMVFTWRTTRTTARLVAWSVLVLTAVGVLMLSGITLGPVLTTVRPDPEKTRVTILADATESMNIQDSYTGDDARWLTAQLPGDGPAPATGPLPRHQVVSALLRSGSQGWIEQLRDRVDLRVLRIANELEGMSLEDEAPYQVDEDAISTPLGDALNQAAEGVVRGAFVLISDGAWNTGSDPAGVARQIGKRQTPVFVVGVGSPQERKDRAVLAVDGPESVLAGDEVIITARVAARGLGTHSMDVELWEGGDRVAVEQVTAPASGDPVAARFSLKPRQPGQYTYTVRLPASAQDQEPANNEGEVSVSIERRKIRVLLADSQPRYEFRHLRNVLERDWAVELTMHIVRPYMSPIRGPGYAHQLPTEPRELLEYDLFILGDIAREHLPPDFLDGLAKHVQTTGGALVVIAGRQGHFRELNGTPLARLLPVELSSEYAASGGPAYPFRAELTSDGARHLITQMSGAKEENRRIWEEEIEPIRWSATVGELRPGAVSLLVHPERMSGPGSMPIVAVQAAGAGKVMWVGTGDTWRWRKEVGDLYHYTFWAQAIRWLTRRQFTDADALARVALSKPETRVGQSVGIDVLVVDDYGYPRADADVELRIYRPEGGFTRVSAKETPGSWGLYSAVFTPRQAGSHRIQPIVEGVERGSAIKLPVTRPNLERNRLEMDLATLRDIATNSGGQYLNVGEMSELPPLLEAQIQQKQLTEEYSPCRNWVWYVALALVMSSAWYIRKRSGLA